MSERKPILAICYDFDKTLSPDDMQAQGYIQSVEMNVEDFWEKSNRLAKVNDMDTNLAYMYLMAKEAEGKLLFTKRTLAEYGSRVALYPGVREWFGKMNAYGHAHGVEVEHYIISSGLKEMIEGTPIAAEFKKIYASSFYYNDREVAVWPAQAVNYTNKTQFLFRIKKGVLDINSTDVNRYYRPEDMRIPFRNIVYIGDSMTDIPCMKLVHSEGGHAIGVYHPESFDQSGVKKLLQDGRIRYYAPADYREGSELFVLLQHIIESTAAMEKLVRKHEKDSASLSQ